MFAGNVMDVEIEVLGPGDAATEAVRIIIEKGVSEVAVVDPGGKLLGVVSEAALLRGMPFSNSAAAADFLVKEFFNLPPDTPLSGVAELFAGTGVRTSVVYILDPGGRLLGGISAKDLLKREWQNLKKEEEKGK